MCIFIGEYGEENPHLWFRTKSEATTRNETIIATPHIFLVDEPKRKVSSCGLSFRLQWQDYWFLIRGIQRLHTGHHIPTNIISLLKEHSRRVMISWMSWFGIKASPQSNFNSRQCFWWIDKCPCEGQELHRCVLYFCSWNIDIINNKQSGSNSQKRHHVFHHFKKDAITAHSPHCNKAVNVSETQSLIFPTVARC